MIHHQLLAVCIFYCGIIRLERGREIRVGEGVMSHWRLTSGKAQGGQMSWMNKLLITVRLTNETVQGELQG